MASTASAKCFPWVEGAELTPALNGRNQRAIVYLLPISLSGKVTVFLSYFHIKRFLIHRVPLDDSEPLRLCPGDLGEEEMTYMGVLVSSRGVPLQSRGVGRVQHSRKIPVNQESWGAGEAEGGKTCSLEHLGCSSPRFPAQ